MRSLTSSRADMLSCCSEQSSTYVGVDPQCTRSALFCLQHNPHISQQTHLLHQMIPVKTFKHNLYDAKFKMGEKVQSLVKEYQLFMNKLIEQLQELQVRKKIQLSMLWLRQLAEDEQQYENMRKIYRMDFEGLRCRDIAKVYFKIHKGQKPPNKKNDELSQRRRGENRNESMVNEQSSSIYQLPIQQLQCYQGMIEILDKLNNSQSAYNFIRDKVVEIEGVIQSGEILKKALPKQILIEGSLKEVLLQTPHFDNIGISYNKLLVKGQRKTQKDHNQQQESEQRTPFMGYYSIFSKYSISKGTKYHITVNTLYGNIMIGVCRESMLKKLFTRHENEDEDNYEAEQERQKINDSWTFLSFSELDLVPIYNMHYQQLSLVYNCSNGCLYHEGAFTMQHSTPDVKDQNEFKLALNVVDNQMIITYNKLIVARCSTPSPKHSEDELLLHILTRTEGDRVVVERQVRKVIKNQYGDDIEVQEK